MTSRRLSPGSLGRIYASYLRKSSRSTGIFPHPATLGRFYRSTNSLAAGKDSHSVAVEVTSQFVASNGHPANFSGSSLSRHEATNVEMVHIKPYEPFPSFWLRENCQCSECIHPVTRQRTVGMLAVPQGVKPKSVNSGRNQVTVEWSDGHAGVYTDSWLSTHQLKPNTTQDQRVLDFRKFQYVSNGQSHPTVEYQDAMKKDESLALWLAHIIHFGYSLVRGVPVEPEATKLLLERIAFIRHTHYGGFWDFTSDLTYKDTAYTSDALDVHTDNTYFTDPARLQLFHLLSHTEGEGGGTVLVDGFRAAAVMLEESPKNVETLIQVPQPWHSSGNEDVCIQPYQPFPVFERDIATGLLRRIRWNNYDRAAKVDWDPPTAESWYSAARQWNTLLNREDMKITMQLEPGTALIFDNWRILHGRTAFSGKRRMCGGYINNDDFISRHFLLKDGREKTLNALGIPSTRFIY